MREIAAGEILGLIGPNGAGKTTLMRLITRVLTPTRGEVRFDGRPLAAVARTALAREIAVVPQDVPAGLPFTSLEFVDGGPLAQQLEQTQTGAVVLGGRGGTGVNASGGHGDLLVNCVVQGFLARSRGEEIGGAAAQASTAAPGAPRRESRSMARLLAGASSVSKASKPLTWAAA